MEELEVREDITKYTWGKLEQESFYPVLLSPKKGMKPGSTGNRWKVDVNIKLENDI